ncbi:MAG: hypothetical protein ACK4KW_08755 [Gemmobacter sp.]
MSAKTSSTSAFVLFGQQPFPNFAHLVSALQSGISGLGGRRNTLHWHSQDLVLFDVDGDRIALGWTEDMAAEPTACLAIAAGPGTGDGPHPLAGRYETVLRLLLGRLLPHGGGAQPIWHEWTGPVTAEKIEELVDLLAHPAPSDLVSPAQRRSVHDREIDRLLFRMREEEIVQEEHNRLQRNQTLAAWGRSTIHVPRQMVAPTRPVTAPDGEAEPASETDNIPHPTQLDSARLRQALYDSPGAVASDTVAMRLAVGTMSATLVLAAAPVGAALLTWNTLRGADLRMTANALAITGLVQAVLAYGILDRIGVAI